MIYERKVGSMWNSKISIIVRPRIFLSALLKLVNRVDSETPLENKNGDG